MEINVDKLKNELSKLNKLVEEYEDVYLNMYNELLHASSNWQDECSLRFFENVKLEKTKVKITLDETKEIRDIYTYLIDKYEDVGNKIHVILNNKDKINNKFNNYVNKIDDLIRNYKNLDTSFCSYERKMLANEQRKIVDMRNKTVEIKEKYSQIFQEIDEIEKETAQKLSKINIEILKQSNISTYV